MSFDHLATELAGEDEGCAQIDLQYLIPVLVAVLGCGVSDDGAGIVNENVDLVLRFGEPGEESVERRSIGEITSSPDELPTRLLDEPMDL
jgi:hypothetical protein